MRKANTKVEFGYRFLNLSKKIASDVQKRHLNFSWWDYKNADKTTNIGFNITKDDSLKDIIALSEEKTLLLSKSRGLFVMLTCYEDQSGLHFPGYALRVHKVLGGDIDISIVFSDKKYAISH